MNTPQLIDLPNFADTRGELSIAEEIKNIPFKIAAAYLARGIKNRKNAGDGAEKFIVALSGSLETELDDGKAKTIFRLDSPRRGLYVPPTHKVEMRGAAQDAAVLILASAPIAANGCNKEFKLNPA
ncbi:MAG: FdtA/QdtA family cupin domain-containing protein [Opitutales bacterium]|nr:FdtA/QdtA family cupin domain-containing protein [Opitutales bacterium]